MPYLDGLPVAASISPSDIIAVDQGGTLGVPGTAVTRQTTVSAITGLGAGVVSVVGKAGIVTLADLVTGGVASTTALAAETARAEAAEALLAPLASPAFTGTPTAVTAAQGVSSTQIATTAYALAATQFRTPFAAWRTGCVGNGTVDDTTNLIAAKSAARAAGVELLLVGLSGNTFRITSPITMVSGDQIVGVGTANSVTGGTGGSILLATGNFTSVLNAPSITTYRLENFVINTNGTTTKALNITGTSTTNTFCLLQNLIFIGSAAATVVYSSDNLVQFRNCGFFGGSVNTVLLQLDGNNLNTSVTDGWFIGGKGITLTNSGASGMIPSQGIQVKNNVFANFNAPYNILVGGAATYVTIQGNVCDQATGPAVIMTGGVANITVQGNYLGQILATGTVVDINETCANIYIQGNTFGNGAYNIIVGATTGSRAGLIVIDNNNFGAATIACLSLDSVNNCRITNNVDNGVSVPSYQIAKTNAAGGAYTFGNNTWSNTAITVFDTTSSYTGTQDRGVTLVKSGVATVASGTSTVINHGLVATPTQVYVTLQNGALTTYGVSSVGATSFTVTWAVSGPQQVNWTAQFQ